MITFLVLIVPILIILNRLEDSRSRKKVSLDGFKMINGHVVRAEDAGSFRSDQRVQQYTIPSVDQLTVARLEGKVAVRVAMSRKTNSVIRAWSRRNGNLDARARRDDNRGRHDLQGAPAQRVPYGHG